MSKTETAILTPTETAAPKSAAELRQGIFANAQKQQRRPFTFNGVQVEFLQPLVGSMFNQQSDDGDKKSFIIMTMIKNTVAPGTSDRVFEDTDYDSIMELPMTAEIQQVTTIVQELMNIGVGDKVKN